MKQIILRTDSATFEPASAPCVGRLVLLWALYGYAMALVWRALPRDPWGEAAAWAIAALCGLALAVFCGLEA